jgi:hypothetical protein
MRTVCYLSVLWCPLRFPQKIMFCSSSPPVVWRRAHVLFMLLVSNTYTESIFCFLVALHLGNKILYIKWYQNNKDAGYHQQK